jgi:dihydrofolate reductase
MSRVRVNITTSLDGFVAGPEQSEKDPLGTGGEQLHEWLLGLRTFRESHGEQGGEVNASTPIAQEILSNVGATIMGRNMFGGGPGPWRGDWQRYWGDEPPYHHPVFVLTRHPRAPLEMEGGTTFHFVTDGIESALEQAKAAAADEDISIGGGATVVQQYLAAGLLEEILISVVPIFLGGGARLFENLGEPKPRLRQVQVVEAPGVTRRGDRERGTLRGRCATPRTHHVRAFRSRVAPDHGRRGVRRSHEQHPDVRRLYHAQRRGVERNHHPGRLGGRPEAQAAARSPGHGQRPPRSRPARARSRRRVRGLDPPDPSRCRKAPVRGEHGYDHARAARDENERERHHGLDISKSHVDVGRSALRKSPAPDFRTCLRTTEGSDIARVNTILLFPRAVAKVDNARGLAAGLSCHRLAVNGARRVRGGARFDSRTVPADGVAAGFGAWRAAPPVFRVRFCGDAVGS